MYCPFLKKYRLPCENTMMCLCTCSCPLIDEPPHLNFRTVDWFSQNCVLMVCLWRPLRRRIFWYSAIGSNKADKWSLKKSFHLSVCVRNNTCRGNNFYGLSNKPPINHGSFVKKWSLQFLAFEITWHAVKENLQKCSHLLYLAYVSVRPRAYSNPGTDELIFMKFIFGQYY